VFEFVADEVAVELTMSTRAARNRLELAVGLARFPATLAALQAGRLDRYQVGIIVDELGTLTDPTFTPALEAAAIGYGRAHTGAQLRAWLRRRVLAAGPDGTGTIHAELAAADAVAIWRLVDQLAHTTNYCADRSADPTDGALDTRSINARRADTFRDLLLARTSRTGTGAGIGAGAGAVEIQVTVSADTLAGVSPDPGHLAGHGPITPDHARQLAEGDSRWRRLLFDPATGTLQHLSQQSYRPGAPLTRAINARDRTCRFPGCNRATTSTGVDLDHTTPWPAGRTEPDNLAALCRHHHRLKQHPQWQLTQLPGNVLEWTTPTGRTFHTHPHDHRPTNHQPDQPRPGAPPDKAA